MQYLFIFCLFFSSLGWGDQLIIEPEMGRAPVINAIQNSHYALNVVMYGLTDQALINAILKKKLSNIAIKMILEERPYKSEDENNKVISLLNKNNIAWQGRIPGFSLIHQKTLIVDHRRALIMTFNFTHSAFKNDRNFALVLDDPVKVKEIESVFDADWQHRRSNTHFSDILYSPDNSRKELCRLITHADHTLNIYTQTMSDYQLIGALAKAARRKVIVNILTSNPLTKKRMHYLKRAGVNIRISKRYYIHAKVFIIDNQTALIGSINFTPASLDMNRELSVITHEADVIKQLNATFASDWRMSEAQLPR